MTLSRSVIRQWIAISAETISSNVMEAARLHFLDALGVALEAASLEQGAPYVRFAKDVGGPATTLTDARLIDGRVDHDTFRTGASKAVLDLAARSRWEPLADHRFPAAFEAEIECRLTGGARLFERVDDVFGNAARPASRGGSVEVPRQRPAKTASRIG